MKQITVGRLNFHSASTVSLTVESRLSPQLLMFRLRALQPWRAAVRPQDRGQQRRGRVPPGLPPLLPHLRHQLPLHAGRPCRFLPLRLDLRQVRPDELSDDGLSHLCFGRFFRVSHHSPVNTERETFLAKIMLLKGFLWGPAGVIRLRHLQIYGRDGRNWRLCHGLCPGRGARRLQIHHADRGRHHDTFRHGRGLPGPGRLPGPRLENASDHHSHPSAG